MSTPHSVPSHTAPSRVTLAAIGATACMAADLVHELIGHGIAARLLRDPILSVSTVALQTAHPSRLVSGAGTCANVGVGILSLLLLRRARRLTSPGYFLWVFAAFNLLNVGYLVASAIMGSGDWANVIAGLKPAWQWRGLLGLAGIAMYVVACRWLAVAIGEFVNRAEFAVADRRLTWPAYWAGGVILTAAACLNPISPRLILVSGIGASFGLNAGLLWLPEFVAATAQGQRSSMGSIPWSAAWLVVALGSSALFIAVLGPGIRF